MSSPDASTSSSAGWRRGLAALFRWLHIYLSMVGLVALLFFAVTGVTLNHADWFDSAARTVTVRAGLDPARIRGTDAAGADRLRIVEDLRAAHRISGALADFTTEDGRSQLSFRGPGYTAEVALDHATGAYELTETRMGLFALLNDLHKGRDSGRAWSWVIDVSGVLMSLVSLSGLALIFYLRRRRLAGLLALAAGGFACVAIYALFVP